MAAETVFDQPKWFYWQCVINEVLNKKDANYRFLFTNLRALHIAPESLMTLHEKESPRYSSKVIPRFYLGDEYPNVYLTKREATCAYYLALGRNIREIALEILLSVRTVEFYIKNIKRKMRCKKRSQLVGLILDIGFLEIYETNLKNREEKLINIIESENSL